MADNYLLYLLSGLVLILSISCVVLSRSQSRKMMTGTDQYAGLISTLCDACALVRHGRIIAFNDALAKIVPRNRNELQGQDTYNLMQSLGADLGSRESLREEIVRSGSISLTYPYTQEGGEEGYRELYMISIDAVSDNYLLFIYDVSPREAREELLRQREAQFNKAKEIIGLGFWVYDVKQDKQEWSDQLRVMFGIETPEEEAEYTDNLPALRHIHPEDADIADRIRTAIADGEDLPPISFRILLVNGETKHVQSYIGRILDKNGVLTHIVAIFQDLTEKIENDHRFRQAQKMEAVGNLTGGLAHDFNNLLHVILGNAEIMTVPDAMEDRESLTAISRAATRGAELTQRLLAFSRKQVLQLKTANVEQSIKNMLPLLSRTLGASISVEMHPSLGIKNCYIDTHQLESCILNLAINARHAMPDGGKLTIETANTSLDQQYADKHEEVTPGEYVQLTISDTGIGMSAEIIDRVFEPFFTTREVGQGSGLGLSMVFGFIKQSNGHITIYSEEGSGTSVKIYLPVTADEVTVTEQQNSNRASMIVGKALLVEDNLQVAELTSRFLEGIGFDVVSATDSESASVQIAEHNDFTLLLTDVMLPGGFNGPEVAKNFSRLHPAAKIIYMSGYTENAIAHHGVLDDGTILLNKPFTRDELVEKILHVLGDPEDHQN